VVVAIVVVIVIVAVVVVAVVITRPTSLNREEGHLAGLLHVVGHELGWQALGGVGRGMREDESKSTVMSLMAV
jgi:hypothetical protein